MIYAALSTPSLAQEDDEDTPSGRIFVDVNRDGLVDVGDFFVKAPSTQCQSCPRAPRLLIPKKDAVVPQNNAFGCTPHATRGYGIQMVFDWADVSDADGIAAYDIYAKKDTASFPIIDTSVPFSTYTHTSCNSFVIDSNLTGWEWKVRARDNLGNVGPWRARTFSFAPCKLADGTSCYAL